MHFFTALLFLSGSIVFATTGVLAVDDVVVDDDDVSPQFSPLGLKTKSGKISTRAVVPSTSLDRRQSCQGTCQTCFGPTYTDCPDSDYLCYDPNEGPASQACSGGGGGGGGGGGSPTSSAIPETTSAAVSDTCLKKGANCQTCFGAGSISCPSGSYYDCYQPDVFSEAEGCNQGGRGGGSPPAPTSSPAGSSSTACEAQYGDGSLECGTGHCYSPNSGESCCGDGSYCPAGTECMLRGSAYRCSESGSDASFSSNSNSNSITTATATATTRTRTTIGAVGNAASESESRTTSSAETATRTISTSTSTSTPTRSSSTSTNSPSAAATLAVSAATRLSLLQAAAASLIPGLWVVMIGLL